MKKLILIICSSLIAMVMMAQHDYQIHLKSGKFIPEVTTDFVSAITPRLTEHKQAGFYRIIQFNEIPSQAEQEAIATAGIRWLSYSPNGASACRIEEGTSSQAFLNLNIRSLFEIQGEFKVSKALASQKLPEWALNGDHININVKYFSKLDEEALVSDLEAMHAVVLEKMETINTLVVQCPVSELYNLAEHPLVIWLDVVAPPSIPDDTEGKASSRSAAINTKYLGGRQYDGTDMVVALADQGFIGPHIDFTGRVTNHQLISSGNHQYLTTGIFIGAGNLDPNVEGVAPGAEINIYRVEPLLSLGILAYPHISGAVEHYDTIGSVITSTSYSQGEGGVYTSDCEFVDDQVTNNQQLMHLFSAGNSGTRDHGYGAGAGWGNISGGTKAAKNVICVGNMTAASSIFTTSSRGPADDGRIKPDIVAKGEGHITTDMNNTYQNGSGTSASTPLIAGIVTQLYQAYKEMNNGEEPESALIKGTMLNTARDIENVGPDYKSGWGSVNALKALRVLEDERYVRDSIVQSQNVDHTFTVPENVAQLKVMTYWSDAAASPSAAKALVNDINMQVTDQLGGVHNPWVLDPTPVAANLNAPAVQGIDDLNNVEQVSIDNPAAGDYVVNIDGFSIPEGPQTYYIIYEFIYDEVELVYPLGGEGFVPFITSTIHWDASNGTDNFTLEYSTDGGASYNLLSSTLSSSTRSYDWSVPDIPTGQLKLKVSRGDSESESLANNTIASIPSNFRIASICPDSVELEWSAVSGATAYEVSMLGDRYMDSIGRTNATNFKVYELGLSEGNWFSVRAIVDGNRGQRAIAIYQDTETENCLLNRDIEVVQLVYPVDGVTLNCNEVNSNNMLVEIENKGQEEISDIELSYQIDDGAIVTEVFAGPIAPGAQSQYAFIQQPDFTLPGSVELKVWNTTVLDENIYNDSVFSSIIVVDGVSISSFPSTETFQSFSNCSTAGDCGAINCGLSGAWINLENNVFDDIDWRTDNAGTGTDGTGPQVDYDLGTTSGKYLYLEGSGSCEFKEAALLSPCIDLSNESCAKLSFAYHMYGSHIGELHVDVISSDGKFEDVMTPVIGDQGNIWRLAEIDLSPYAGQVINVQLRGSTGDGYISDMAIDAISIETFAATTADFTFTSNGDEVTFSNNSSGNIDSYFWTFGDGNTSTETNPVHTYSSSGVFDVTLVVSGPCGQDTFMQTVGASSVAELDYARSILIHPNPNNGSFMVSLPNALSQYDLNFEIVNIIGESVMELNEKADLRNFFIDASTIVDGVYFLRISGDHVNLTKRFIKN